MAGRKKKAPGKVVKFTGRHVLDDLVGAEKRKEMQIKEPLIIDFLTSLSATYNKPPKKKAVKARFDDKFGNPIKKLDDLILSLKPKKKMNMGGLADQNRKSSAGQAGMMNPMGGMTEKKKFSMGMLSGGQVKLDKNKDGKISGDDFNIMRKK